MGGKEGNQSESLENELDSTLIEYLSELDLYQLNQVKLSQELKSGYFDLARTKLSLGPTRIGPSSFDLGECLSRISVTISPLDENNVVSNFSYELGPSESSLDPLLTVCSTSTASKSSSSSLPLESTSTATISTATNLRNRSKLSSSSTLSTPANSTESGPIRPLSRDPIYQFSAFPPPPLRDSQKSFERVLGVMVENVRIRSRVEERERRIDGIKKELGRV